MSTHTSIRRSPIAGTWYPGGAHALRAMVEGFLAHVPAQPLQGELRALIAPHAGYAYSGQTAAHGYKQILGKQFDTVIVAGPSHFAWVGDFAISAESAYETPLGTVALDEAWIERLSAILPVRRVRGDREHSVEMQLPFLQVALGAFKFVPILMSAETVDACEALGRAIADLVRGSVGAGQRPAATLLVASSDLNHIESYREVVRRDADVIRAIERFELQQMARVLLDPAYTVCGRAPLLAMSAAAQALGATRVQVLQHTNSGDVTGRTDEGTYTVGYLSAALVAGGA